MTFESLIPEMMINAVENASGIHLTGLTSPLPSYINRVYELRSIDGLKLIVKFYRPGRWTRAAIIEEHQFIIDCNDAEIPVVPPLTLKNGTTLGEIDNILFALYPKRAGRQLEITSESDWVRLGSLAARIHCAGEKRKSHSRIVIHPQRSTLENVNFLCESVLPPKFKERYRSIVMRLIDGSNHMFNEIEQIRIHGDLHAGNILNRLDEGLLVIDFDDMAMGPPVQDLWLLLPDHASQSMREIELLLQGYERFRGFDRASIKCIEPLRAMRMIYFLAWCSSQIDDYRFRTNFPEWGTDSFWQREINDLSEQVSIAFEEY